MIVGSCFDGDNNKTLMQMQHEIYGEMIAYMFGSARRRYQEAAMLLDVKTDLSESLIDQYSVDHRTLQRTHDLIAAYYRFKHDDGGQLQLNENAEAIDSDCETRRGSSFKRKSITFSSMLSSPEQS